MSYIEAKQGVMEEKDPTQFYRDEIKQWSNRYSRACATMSAIRHTIHELRRLHSAASGEYEALHEAYTQVDVLIDRFYEGFYEEETSNV